MGRRPVVAGNWKMHGSKTMAFELLSVLIEQDFSELDVVVFPPSLYIPQVSDLLGNNHVSYGVQNISEHEEGAYTGEIAVSMIEEFSCKYVLIGHSERRTLYGETNQAVAAKFHRVKQTSMIPMVCVGETKEQREKGLTNDIIKDQLEALLGEGIDALNNTVIAYEPVWAIGTGLTATPEQAQETHQFIRQWMAKENETIAEKTRILYGGSVKPNNAKELFAMPDIDGGLVGGASLKADSFVTICRAIGH